MNGDKYGDKMDIGECRLFLLTDGDVYDARKWIEVPELEDSWRWAGRVISRE